MSGLGVAIALALAYALTTGLHDAANSIATLVATRAARPGAAIVVATAGSLVGPLVLGAAVGKTVAGIPSVAHGDQIGVLGAALTGAVAWNVVTWLRGVASSPGHALVGGLTGAAVATGGVGAVTWGPLHGWRPAGVGGVLAALAIAPVIGFVAGFVADVTLRRSLARAMTSIRRPVSAAQWVASGLVAVGQGANDAQKSIGLAAALLLAAGHIHDLRAPTWVVLACGAALAVGTALGGWPIVHTIGRRLFRLRPVDGVASEGSSALVVLVSSAAGAPVSTTQVVASTVVGTGAGRGRVRHVRWEVVRGMVVAWLVTLPGCAMLAALATVPWGWLR